MPIAGLVYRIPNGAPLTAAQLDNNFLLLSNGYDNVQTQLNGNQTWINATPPSVDKRGTTVWHRLTGSPARYERSYVWDSALSLWIVKHAVPESSNFIAIWIGDLTTLATFDGGDGGAPGVASGPMWKNVASTFDARFPIGVGTLPSTATITLLGTGGEEQHTLITNEMPAHTHDTTIIAQNSDSSGSGALTGGTANSGNDGQYTGTSTSVGGGSPHNNMPPLVGVYFIQRTSRAYYAQAG